VQVELDFFALKIQMALDELFEVGDDSSDALVLFRYTCRAACLLVDMIF
jgi:hypothetical protein